MSVEEEPEISIKIEIMQIKKGDLVLQESEAMTLIDNEKQSFEVPFEEPIEYEFDTLNQDFIFKYAILQNDDLMGILYLEVPYRYKFTRKFRIDDWFFVKPYEQVAIGKDEPVLARVVITYQANCKLSQDTGLDKNLVEFEGEAPKKEIKAKMRELTKNFEEHEKAGFPHLEEVERRIRARRRRNPTTSGAADRSAEKNGPLGKLNQASNRLKNKKLKRRATGPAKSAKQVAPGDMYRYGVAGSKKGSNKNGGGAYGRADVSRLNEKMANEMVSLRKQLAQAQKKLKAMEEGQMTVDNKELMRVLEEQQDQMNKDRGSLLKDYAKKDDQMVKKQKQIEGAVEKREKAAASKEKELEAEKRRFEVDSLEIKDKLSDLKRRVANVAAREESARNNEQDLVEKSAALEDEKNSLHEYNDELQDLKERLLEERNNILEERSKNTSTKLELERSIKDLKKEHSQVTRELNKKKDENRREENKMQLLEDKLRKEQEHLAKDKADVLEWKEKHDEKLREVDDIKSQVENEQLMMWKERNSMQKDLKQFMYEKHMLEQEIGNQKKEIQIAADELDGERDELDQERRSLQEFYDKLELMEKDLIERENKLLDDQDQFARMQKNFVAKVMEKHQGDGMDDKLHEVATDLGIDIDRVMAVTKNIENRKQELDKLKRQNANAYALMRRGSQLTIPPSAGGGGSGRRVSKLFMPGGLSGPNGLDQIGKGYKNKLLIAEYLQKMYEDALLKSKKEEIEEEFGKLMELKEDHALTKKLADNALSENRVLKKEMDELKEIIKELQDQGMDADLSKYFVVKQNKKTDTKGLMSAQGYSQRPVEGYSEEKYEDIALKKIAMGDPNEIMAGRSQGTGPNSQGGAQQQFNFPGLEGYGSQNGGRDQAMRGGATPLQHGLPIGSTANLSDELKKILSEIKKANKESHSDENKDASERLRRLQYLVYYFVHNTFGFLADNGSLKDRQNRQLLDSLVRALKSQMGKLRESYMPVLTYDEDLRSRLLEAYETISRVEKRNLFLIDLVQNLKNTYEYFELANDQAILGERPYAMVN